MVSSGTRLWRTLLVLCGQMLICACTAASPTIFASGKTQVGLLELYTSEGCSSCPPADRWLSEFKQNPQLWKTVVPVAFHVDYWNDLGWPDRFASPDYSSRQRFYRHAASISNVYTPGFVWGGKEWRGFFSGRDLSALTPRKVGNLSVRVEHGIADVHFQPVQLLDAQFRLSAALLGFDLSTDVTAGENRGRKLSHDFAVLRFLTKQLQQDHEGYYAQFELSQDALEGDRHALAVWVSANDDPRPIQSVGGWLQD